LWTLLNSNPKPLPNDQRSRQKSSHFQEWNERPTSKGDRGCCACCNCSNQKDSQNFKGRNEKETAAKVFNYLKTQVNYKADRNEQNVQLPSAIMRDRQADCKSYSLFTMGVLNNLGIPAKLRYASYANDPTPTHVYVVTNGGTIIDAVYGKFNAEKPYTYKKDKSINGMNINYISGIGNMPKKISDHGLGQAYRSLE
jgi:hypothetical protein